MPRHHHGHKDHKSHKDHKNHDNNDEYKDSKKADDNIKLTASYPWEIIKSNRKTFQFIVMNFFTNLFDQRKIVSISHAIKKYVKHYVFPSWRFAIDIKFFVPPSIDNLTAVGVIPGPDLNGCFINPLPVTGSYIPIYLVDEFSNNIANNYGAAVYGNVSGSVMNGYNALNYLNDNDTYSYFGPLPFGTPFIVIPAGSSGDSGTGNGINGLVNSNIAALQKPDDFYQALSKVMCQEIINVLINPTGVYYIATGNPQGLYSLPTVALPINGSQIFFLKEATTPFSQGTENTHIYKSWTMCNFAYPTYFFPYNNSGVYDFLGNGTAPFVPHKGTQFSLQQSIIDNDPTNVTDMEVVIYVSPLDFPYNIEVVNNGSIYSYPSWGLVAELNSNAEIEDMKLDVHKIIKSGVVVQRQNKKHIARKTISTGFYNRRAAFASHFDDRTTNNTIIRTFKAIKSHHLHHSDKFKKGRKQLLPFQFIDHAGFLSTRFAIVNYSPVKMPPSAIDTSIPALQNYLDKSYLPHWNNRPIIIANYTILTDTDLPVFDGTFIPLFIFRVDQFDQSKLGGLVSGGGATNVNNNPNILAGPFITEYVLNAPNLPIGIPYLMFPDSNFPGQVVITTNQAGLGPFIGLPMSTAIQFEGSLPITASGGVASPDINACTALTPNSLTGKIGVNVRGPCNSLVYPPILANAGAIATITIATSAAVFSGDAQVFGVTCGPDANALITAINSNPDLLITISATESSPNDILVFTSTITHEIQELSLDPSYADYIATSNPPEDGAILFSQYENADQDESIDTMITDKVNSYAANGFPLPSYYVANMNYASYDNVNTTFAPLIPQSRQQMLYQVQGDPIQVGYTYGYLDAVTDLDLVTFGNIFDPQTFYPPGNNPYSYESGGVQIPMASSPLASIYDNLQNLRNIYDL